MKLVDLNPRWVGAGGEGVSNADGTPAEERHGVGISLDCPCGVCDPDYAWLYVSFKNPMDGKPPLENDQHLWNREGDTFETLTLTPSILRSKEKGGCGWHGFITNGEIISC